MQCVISIEGPLWNICTIISMICLIYQISKKEVFFREKLDHLVKRKLRMCVFVCVVGRVCANYNLQSTSTHEKGLEPPSSTN